MNNRDSSIRVLRPALTAALGVLMIAGACVCPTQLRAATHPRLVITPAPGFAIAWDGNNGGFSNPDAGAGPSNNVALASNGTVPFSSSDLGPELGIPFHVAANLNDGLYGNINSWISGSAPDPYAALRFAASVNISSIAWGRDNGFLAGDSCGGTCMDRAVGTYTLQVTRVAGPDNSTPDTGDAATGWATIGTVQYLPGAEDASFTSYLRHRFDVAEGGSPIAATGLRIKVSVGGLGGGLAIDEIEVNPIPDLVPPIGNFIDITPAAGFGIAWDRNEGLYSTPNSPAPVPANDASASRGAAPFTSSDLGPALGIPFHRAVNLNDGLYGNSYSWIPNFIAGDATPFAGINFGRRRLVGAIAWSRDNGDVAGDCCGGTLTDRTLGVYVIQITTVPNPGAATPEACGPTPASGWVTVGTINFKANHPSLFNSHLRHRFDLTQGGAPIAATGIRIKVPNANSAIDEIEVNSNLAIENGALRITSAPGAAISWDGNNGHFNDPAVGAAPPANRALASQGTTPFTSSDLGPALGIPFHRAVNLNDGLYGNANSWISANGIGGASDPDPFAGLSFGGSISITNIAWGRDNGNVAGDCCGGTLTDRSLDTYRLQYTSVASPDATTPDTGDAATGWQDLGTVTYVSAAPPSFTPYLRHRYELSSGGGAISATGIRIKVASGNTAIDEIEINTSANPPAPPSPVEISPAAGYAIGWDGNDGHYNNPAVVAPPPDNRALATAGTVPFTSSDLGPALGIPFHRAVNLNDGLYGNANSWIPNFIGGDPAPFAGLSFGGTVAITNIAWSRDNGNVAADCCGGTATDRVLGAYTIQITTVASPDASTAETGDASTGWESVGTINYLRAEPPDFNPHLRHRFDLSSAGGPILATGLRIKVPDANSDIDEIEVNTSARAPRDVTPPAIRCPDPITAECASPAGTPVTFQVTANDPCDGPVTPTCTPSSGSTFPLGPTTVTCVATDADGNSSRCSFTVSVVDTTTPAISCPANLAVDTFVPNGANVPYAVSASDACGLRSQECTPPGNHFPVGTTTVNCTAVDQSGLSSSCSFTVTVRLLNQPPTAVISSEQLINLSPEFEHPVLLSCNWWNACLVADGLGSSDPEGGALTFLWSLLAEPVPVGIGPVITNCLEVGEHTILLTVTDPHGLSGTTNLTIEIVTAPLAIELLIEEVTESHKSGAALSRKLKRELTATLRVALAHAGQEELRATQKTLDAFEKKVRAQVARDYPELATAWIRWSQAISEGMEKCIKPPRKPGHEDGDGDDKKDDRGGRK